jgi:hypothetical protein
MSRRCSRNGLGSRRKSLPYSGRYEDTLVRTGACAGLVSRWHYLVKPFEPAELLARIAALLRRVHKHQLTPVLRFHFGDVIVDFSQARVSKRGQPVNSRRRDPNCFNYSVWVKRLLQSH